jgi:phosphonate ABC transporter permease subunit PhnE
MALVASTVGTALAVPISFLAARNLMEDIVAPLASVMAAIVALAVGVAVGMFVTNKLLDIAEDVADNSTLGLPVVLGLLLAILVSGAFLWLVLRARKQMSLNEELSPSARVISGLLLILAFIISVIGLGLVAHLGLEIGAWLREVLQFFTFLGINFFGFIGDMIFVLSDLFLLFMPALVALLIGLIFSSYASRYAQEAVISWTSAPARILTGVLALLGSFVISFGFGAFLNWFYQFDNAQNAILVPSIGGGIVAAVLALTLIRIRPGIHQTLVTLLRLLIFVAIAAGTAFLVVRISDGINQALDVNSVLGFMVAPALIGGVVAAVIAGFAKPNHPYGIGFGIYTITRGILNILRSIEPLIMGIVFVVWVSLGPFAGILALTLHSIAALGKLFSEQVEGIDQGPVEAITATGASRLQMVAFAVIPQIIPPFTAFALYRWDINVRMSTIIGFVGGGGIGFVLNQNIRLLRYRQASVMMLAIALVVASLDYASAKIRSRII